MPVSIALTAATVCSLRLHKTSQRDAMARDPRRDLLGRDRHILLRDRGITRSIKKIARCVYLHPYFRGRAI